MPAILDHVFVFVLVIAWPLYAAFYQYPRLKRGIAAGLPGIRSRAYVKAIATQWVLVIGAIIIWKTSGRLPAELGFVFTTGWRLGLGVLVVVAVAVLFEIQRRKVTGSRELHIEFKRKVENASALLPDNPKELFLFHAISVTAGVCEEILFRGFLIWYLSQFMGVILAVIGSSVLFGLAHLYQGQRGIMQTGVVGFIFALLYVITGTLWVPMVLHTLVDMNSGILWYQIKDTLATETAHPPDTGVES